MSINYCTLSSSTIDTFCGNQRNKVLNRLLDEKYTVVQPPAPSSGGWTYGPISGTIPGVRPDVSYAPPPYQRPELDRDLPKYESPWVTVTAEVFKFRGSETQETSVHLDFVVVTDIVFSDAPDISVNITEMEI